jgi:hypothetical protein
VFDDVDLALTNRCEEVAEGDTTAWELALVEAGAFPAIIEGAVKREIGLSTSARGNRAAL